MRKIIICVVALIFIFLLASCDKQEEETTTTPSYYVTEPTTSATTTTAASYVLTTAQGSTVYWQETTRFEFDATTQSVGTTANQSSSDYDIDFTVSPISKPDINTSVITSAPTTAAAEDNTSYVIPTTAADSTQTQTQEQTQAKEVESVDLVYTLSNDGDGNITLEIDASNWNGGLSSCSVNVIVAIDGTESETTPTLVVPSKTNSLGYYDCEIDLSGLEVTDGTVVTFTIPAGSIKNPDGTQTNQSCSDIWSIGL